MRRWAAVARYGGVGDNLVAASPLPLLKRMGYMVEVITSEPNHVVFHNNPYVDKLSVKKPERDLPKDNLLEWQRWHESRAREYDVFGHLSHSMEGRHAVFQTMTSFWWPADYRRKVCAGSYLETAHDICGVPYEFGPLYFPTDEERERARETKRKVGERCVTWVISGSRIDKVYVNTGLVVARVIRELGVPVVLMGAGEKEDSMAASIREFVQAQNSSLEGLHLALSHKSAERGGDLDWPLRRSLAFACGSDVVVTPDTGPAWAVAFESMPKVVMVSHASVENITKHWINTKTLHADPNRVPCWPCHRLHDVPETCVPNKDNNGAACISDISVEEMLQSVREALQQKIAKTELRVVA
jgi:ADP-heptose:LPS heptosyltransferase